jgi:hypothetical protein
VAALASTLVTLDIEGNDAVRASQLANTFGVGYRAAAFSLLLPPYLFARGYVFRVTRWGDGLGRPIQRVTLFFLVENLTVLSRQDKLLAFEHNGVRLISSWLASGIASLLPLTAWAGERGGARCRRSPTAAEFRKADVWRSRGKSGGIHCCG